LHDTSHWDRTWIAAAGGTRQLDRNGRHWLATTSALGTHLSFMYPGSNRKDPRFPGTGGSRKHRADALIHDDEENLKGEGCEAYLHKTRDDGGGRSEQTSNRARVWSHQRASGWKESMRRHAFVQLTLASARDDAWQCQQPKIDQISDRVGNLKSSLDAETRRFASSWIKEAGVGELIG
jgi:hypothetical protein